MKKTLLLILISFQLVISNDSFSQCANSATLISGTLTPPGVGLSTTQTYNAGEYMLAFVSAGANYTVTTCGNSAYDTQLTVYDDATGTFLAYNDDACGLLSNTSFTATTCGNVRVLLHQYSCNPSGLPATVIMTMNTGGNVPSISSPLADAITCMGVPVTIGDTNFVTGGASPYTYSWLLATSLDSVDGSMATATVNAATSYTLTITDTNNCSVYDTVLVDLYPQPNVNLGADSGLCAGTNIILDAGNAGSAYLWNDASTSQTLNVSSAGMYTVSVTNTDGCTSSDSVNFTINPLPVVDLGADSSQCGGSIILDAANPGAMYLWSDSSNAQTLIAAASGAYSVSVTDALTSCSAADTINVSINSIPVINFGADTTQCAGSVLLDAGNSGSAYLWNDSTAGQTLSVNASGTYYVTVTSADNCVSSDTIQITINSLPVVNLGPDSSQCFGTILLDAGNPGMNYLWSDSSTTQTLLADTSSAYYVFVTDPSTGCVSGDTVNININDCTGMSSAQTSGSVVIYPNPGDGLFSIVFNNLNSDQLNLTVLDLQGKVVYSYKETNVSGSFSKQIDLTGLSKGIYYIRLNTGNTITAKKLIIQ
jgi:hypothetical protein